MPRGIHSVLASDAMIMCPVHTSNYQARGLLLAFGAGTYIHIGAIECMSVVYNSRLQSGQTAAVLLAFIVGAVAIGLVLIDHEHCSTTATSSTAACAAANPGGDGHSH